MILNRIELKKVMYDFNSIANRFMRVDFQEYNIILAKFLAHLDNVEIISEYIRDCGQPTYDVKTEIDEVAKSHGSYFDLGDTKQQEVTNIYHILKYCSENKIFIPQTIARSYSTSNKWQDMTKGFNERVSMVLIRHIEGYLTKIGIDMGMDEHVKYSITVNNGQVNLATDNATINATQNNGVDIQQLKALLDSVRQEAILRLSQMDIETVKESLEVIESEIAQPKPRKSFIQTAIKGLQAIKSTVEFSAAVVTLAQFIKTVL